MRTPHLIGAYGMLWDRWGVNWQPGSAPLRWQLLGRRGVNRGRLTACDFRQARGFYVLFDDFRAVYAGIARGRGGIGARLKAHHKNRGDWSRFCWFSFDDVTTAKWSPTWSEIKQRRALGSMSPDLVVREAEALLITVLGLTQQNMMHFQSAKRWEQLTDADFYPGGPGTRLDEDGFTDIHYRYLLRSSKR